MVELTEQKQQQRAMWAMGDYPTASQQIAAVGPACVNAAGVTAGDTVLDVACGAGNATIPAAKTGAKTTGLDLTPELLEAGRRAAAEAGVEIEWVEGDAEQLPFEDASFDAVMSVFGCMFAPDHQAAAAELARVLKPGGRLAVCAWTPDGSIGQFFMTVAKHLPPPPEGFQPPILWGSEEHAREIFDGTGLELDFERQTMEFCGGSREEFLADMERDLPPIVNARRLLEPAGKWQALRDEIEALYEAENQADDGSYRAPGEYLVIRGKKS
ncbi:MAG TPA: methyltransferase domain-containing protein [Solirubrobacterales bacterium]|nr:methyltransferase domain-containing protein [Solirubrobacterales bacterium]